MHKRNRIVSLKKDNLSQRSCQNELSQPSLPRIELERQGSLSQEKIHIHQNLSKCHKYL